MAGSQSESENVQEADESSPLLVKQDADWKPPSGFWWTEVAIFANVFLAGFDGTITASTYAVISSEFGAANTASWLTTSYLITSTTFLPLYGRFSDILGRRTCFFVATITFMLGCLGCAVAGNVWILNFMRALTGVGGAGLITVATIINSDLIPFRRRGMYQAMQNVLHGFGSICGASLGGTIADSIGWRWCFALQVPVSAFALGVGFFAIPQLGQPGDEEGTSVWKKLDISGAVVLIISLSAQLLGLSLGGNELPWSNVWVILILVGSVLTLALFLVIEAKTKAMPIIPLRLLRGRQPAATQLANLCFGMATYAYLFMIPLYFQVVLLESASKAGLRLVIPSLGTPIGGIVAGLIMSRYGKLATIVRIGAFFMFLGNALIIAFQFEDAPWKYFVYLIPANIGTGMAYPGSLFTFLALFDHSDHAVSTSTVYLIRSIGSVWGVAITSAITQTVLKTRLPNALEGLPEKWKIVDEVRHSVDALRKLSPEAQLPARLVYYQGIRLSFVASTVITFAGLTASFFTRGKGLERP